MYDSCKDLTVHCKGPTIPFQNIKKLFKVKIGSECFGEIVDSACRRNFMFALVLGGVNPHDRYVSVFIILDFFIFLYDT